MKITLAGSLGRIGRPLAQQLIKDGHTVTIISSNPDRSKDIEASGAISAIGALQNTDFLISTFTGADVAYTLVPPANYFNQDLDLYQYFAELGDSFKKAIENTDVNRVVNLSSIGAHLEKGNGILEGTYYVEQALNSLPEDIAITHIRPVEIYYNLFQFVDLIKHQNIVGSNLDKDDVNAWVSPKDIAEAVADEILNIKSGRNVRYVASEELTYSELATTLGTAIGKPDLQWVQFTDKQVLESLINVGMQPAAAEKMVEMYAAIHSGLLYEDYRQKEPKIEGKVKMKDFAQEFAVVYKNA
ncbi:NmrA family NAD(P)-binding protein [Ulvibacterium marinum]|uniref:NAD-dependent dehydratase n=1 Tax=Ulvibacterium marinum TaxID=2419782 RepID=A0A3B0CAK3_9FLAO|nr:NAD(P)H-binding protein [Ulvibacterium marinum]RKN83535.1 NAD-dependent dehydratase [Ulvibacterium marinum]